MSKVLIVTICLCSYSYFGCFILLYLEILTFHSFVVLMHLYLAILFCLLIKQYYFFYSETIVCILSFPVSYKTKKTMYYEYTQLEYYDCIFLFPSLSHYGSIAKCSRMKCRVRSANSIIILSHKR